jgi:hypothetical protein
VLGGGVRAQCQGGDLGKGHKWPLVRVGRLGYKVADSVRGCATACGWPGAGHTGGGRADSSRAAIPLNKVAGGLALRAARCYIVGAGNSASIGAHYNGTQSRTGNSRAVG